jgi:hypothetical protein
MAAVMVGMECLGMVEGLLVTLAMVPVERHKQVVAVAAALLATMVIVPLLAVAVVLVF